MAVDLAEAAAYSGDIALAIRANDLLIKDPWPQTNPTQHAARAVVSGVASLAGGNRRVAVELLTQAVAAFRTSGWSLLEGRALALLGTAIARHDRARAVETLAQAAERFGSCGAVVRRGPRPGVSGPTEHQRPAEEGRPRRAGLIECPRA